MPKEKILFVDDDLLLLDFYRCVTSDLYTVDIADSGHAALELLNGGESYAVIVSDMIMPVMDGITFLSQAGAIAPDTIRIMLTGYADKETAIEAINQGRIFRFLTKPCDIEEMARVIEAGLKQYRLVVAEKELLEHTLRGAVEVMAEVLAVANPTAYERAVRTKKWVSKIAAELRAENVWQIEIAAMLSQLGCVSLSEEVVHKIYEGKQLSSTDLRQFQNHPQVAHDLLNHIPRFEPIAEIILYQEKRFDGSGALSAENSGDGIPFGARILKVVLDFDKALLSGFTHKEAVAQLQRRKEWYDPRIFQCLEVILQKEVLFDTHFLAVDRLQPGMILVEDILSKSGLVFAAKNQELTASLCQRLKNIIPGSLRTETAKVLLPSVEI